MKITWCAPPFFSRARTRSTVTAEAGVLQPLLEAAILVGRPDRQRAAVLQRALGRRQPRIRVEPAVALGRERRRARCRRRAAPRRSAPWWPAAGWSTGVTSTCTRRSRSGWSARWPSGPRFHSTTPATSSATTTVGVRRQQVERGAQREAHAEAADQHRRRLESCGRGGTPSRPSPPRSRACGSTSAACRRPGSGARPAGASAPSRRRPGWMVLPSRFQGFIAPGRVPVYFVCSLSTQPITETVGLGLAFRHVEHAAAGVAAEVVDEAPSLVASDSAVQCSRKQGRGLDQRTRERIAPSTWRATAPRRIAQLRFGRNFPRRAHPYRRW